MLANFPEPASVHDRAKLAADGRATPLPSDPLFYDALYRAHSRRLLALIGRRIGRNEAEDIVQESFMRFIDVQFAGKTAVEQPGSYLTRIALNLLKDRARRSARHPTTSIVDDYPPINGPSPEGALEARDMLERLNATLSHLTPVTREIYIARRLYGYSHQDISERTGLSLKGIEHHMAKALARIQRFVVRPARGIKTGSCKPQQEKPCRY